MKENKAFLITDEQENQRLDTVLPALLEKSRATVQQWAEQKRITVNERPVSKNYKLRVGDRVCIDIPEPVIYEAKAENIPLQVVYEDADLLVVNKPKGMVVHPAAGHYEGTLVNALLAHCGESLSGINGVLRPGIVHRIDKDTSGLLIVAKSDKAHRGLAEQIKEHSFAREYEAVVVGNLTEECGKIDAPIGRHPTNRKKMAVTPLHSKEAITHYTVLARYFGTSTEPTYTHVRLRLETGRTHQIRVHMTSLGHPVAGDTVYGSSSQPAVCQGLEGQCLHAIKIGFTHPINGQWLEFESELPSYFEEFLRRLQKRT